MSTAHHHAEWLSLLEISGPFLSMPVLLRAFPQGLDGLPPILRSEMRPVYEEWLDDQGGLKPDPRIHRAWVEWVLRHVLEIPERALVDQPQPAWTISVPEHGETLRPDLAVAEPADPTRARLLVQIVPPGQDLDRPLRGSPWSASTATRMMTLLRAAGTRLGLLTNGEHWMLVDAPADGTTGLISWYAHLWLEEPLTLRAFRSLLGAHRFFSVPADQTLETLLAESAGHQQEVTEQLGFQVRRAVEMLVQAIDLADQDRGGALLQGVSEEKLYEAALKVMMRLVFLLSAEERDLLPLDDPFYNQYYAVSSLQAQLREAADLATEEVLERRTDAWCRLLATFRAVHGGIQHDRLALPAYGGGLFEPDDLPFLEGRPQQTAWQTTLAQPLPINNRTVLHLLEALQFLQVGVPGGGKAEARRLSFRALDIEQIGHVYEGLLDHTVKRAPTPVLGLAGAKYQEPEIALLDLEEHCRQGEEALLAFLREQTGRSENALRKALQAQLEPQDTERLRAACGNDAALYERVRPFGALVRPDPYGHPTVIRAGSVYVTAGTERRATGTHYTPRSLTEPIVQRTLEPLVYAGPAEGLPREQWQLRAPAELLDLKICDMAMGSGAFLVQTCRYLSERLVEAWETAEAAHKGQRITPEGQSAPHPDQVLPTDPAERQSLARRLVTDRCLYGVDKNPLAVEMAKLSLWLITMDRGRPFTFLDHALKPGDSIVGVNLEQLTCWNVEGKGARQFDTVSIHEEVEKVVALRREIARMPARDVHDQEAKTALLAQAEAIANDLRRGGDLLVAACYNTLPAAERTRLRDALLRDFRQGEELPSDLAPYAQLDGLHPFHWPLEFPEVFLGPKGGFDAFVGNPPFMGGRRIRETLGDRYRQALYDLYAESSGNADYCAFFFLRAFSHLRSGGTLGLLATNTIAQGDTRQTGLDRIVEQGGTIYRAINNQPWPGQAAVVVDVVHIARSAPKPPFTLDGRPVQYVSTFLDSRKALGQPYRLAENQGKSHMGTNVVGTGFILPAGDAQALIERNPRNAEVLFPFLIGLDLNSSPSQAPSRWIIDFFDWPLSKAGTYPDCLAIVREKVYPERKKKKGGYARLWWQYGRRQERLYEAIAHLRRVLIIAQTSKTLAFSFVPPGMIYSHATIVFAFDDASYFALLQSVFHVAWILRYGSTLKGDARYIPTDCFETFPFPETVEGLACIGEEYHDYRHQIMLSRQEGLTATYNRFHDTEETAADIGRLRELQVEMDRAVAAAYGWEDLELGHGFHGTAQGVRFTIGEVARREVLDRLLALNHQRHEEEVRAGRHEKKRTAGKKKRQPTEQMRLL